MTPSSGAPGCARAWIAVASACVLVPLLTAAAPASPDETLSFGPSMPRAPLVARAGRPVTVINADPTTLHHPFVHKGSLTLDAGDLEPGASGRIAFPEAGRFTVICAVHPRMRADVIVE